MNIKKLKINGRKKKKNLIKKRKKILQTM